MFVLLSQVTGGLALALAFPSAVGPRHCVQLSKSLADTEWERRESEHAVAIKQANGCVHALRRLGVIEVSLIFEKAGIEGQFSLITTTARPARFAVLATVHYTR